MERVKKRAGREWLEALLLALLLVLFVRLFLFEAFTIPSTSMAQTLKPGDFVLVSKIRYGARMPLTPLTFPFAHQYIPFTKIKGYLEKPSLPYLRVPGFSSIERQDVVVFNSPVETDYPVDHRTHIVKRCVGLPADTLHIEEGRVYINGIIQEEPAGLMRRYYLKVNPERFDLATFDRLDIADWQRIKDDGTYHVPLTDALHDSISLSNGVQNIIPLPEIREMHNFLFPFHAEYPWHLDGFGPLIIPSAGATVAINSRTISLYQRIIESEKHEVLIEGDTVLIDGKNAGTYTFQYDYYFVMGDNRYFSADSRYWGFVPETHIIGKAVMVLFSRKTDAEGHTTLRRNRFFKKVE